LREERVRFFSEGVKIEALVRRPDSLPPQAKGYPVIVHGPGFVGLAEMPAALLYDSLFIDAGFAVVAPNYRGFSGSDGERGWILPDQQLQDLINTVTYIETVSDLDASRIGAYGQGGTGGGNAIMLAAVDPRVRCTVSQSPVADGATWLRSMRREHEWLAYLDRLERNARSRVVEGRGEIVDPRMDIMVATPARTAARGGSATDNVTGSQFHLASAEHILRYRPIDFVDKISPRPLLLISLHRDVVTPADLCAELLFEKARAPKTLVRQNEAITHYRSYDENVDVVGPVVVDFFEKNLTEIPRLSVTRNDGRDDTASS
jgi:pimeloyl-ACP methyl ester carboxylesterase